jgi:two-component system, OmpR family, sensor histidine kinase KdpD
MALDDGRPKPERFLALIRQQQRGRLKIYLGYAAGVGKTWDMLHEGHRLKRLGVDVVIGIVETHGRAETAALVEGLEQVPRRRIEYRSVTLEELDTEGILNRRPTICLIDELAHTNVPGSRNAKRYQDVEELLRAGINVITTLNIQHLESLYDIVEKATGVKVKERVPDHVVAEADEIINVDISAEDLRERLEAGKIYPQERVERALANFFTQENLTHLRELALGEIAHALDRRRRKDQPETEEFGPVGRIMVCLRSRSPHAELLLRKTSRLASRLNIPWYAIFIKTPRESIDKIDVATLRRIENMQTMAVQLGGVLLEGKGADVVSTIATFCREYEITHVILGRSQRAWYSRIFGQSVLDRLLQVVPYVDVIVVGNPR